MNGRGSGVGMAVTVAIAFILGAVIVEFLVGYACSYSEPGSLLYKVIVLGLRLIAAFIGVFWATVCVDSVLTNRPSYGIQLVIAMIYAPAAALLGPTILASLISLLSAFVPLLFVLAGMLLIVTPILGDTSRMWGILGTLLVCGLLAVSMFDAMKTTGSRAYAEVLLVYTGAFVIAVFCRLMGIG